MKTVPAILDNIVRANATQLIYPKAKGVNSTFISDVVANSILETA